MPRVKRGVMHTKRRRNILKRAKGYNWGRNAKLKTAKTALKRAGQFAFAGRKTKKRVNRRLWIVKLNAAVRNFELTYSQLINKMTKKKVGLDRKVLSQIAEHHPKMFKAVIADLKK